MPERPLIPWLHARRAAQEVAFLAVPDLPDAASGIPQPPMCDWAWRPAPWAAPMASGQLSNVTDGTRITSGVRLFHDCSQSQVDLRQSDSAPHAVTVAIRDFGGSFLSLAIDLPQTAARSMRRAHILRVTLRSPASGAARVYARLNIRNGPNIEKLTEAMEPDADHDDTLHAEFDLGFHDLHPSRMVAAWLDLMFAPPEHYDLRLEDLTLARRPRAEI